MGGKRNLTITFAVLAVSAFVADRLTKEWILGSLAVGESRHFLGNIIYLTFVHNRGGAFGLFVSFSFIFKAMGVIVPLVILIFFKKLLEKGWGWVIAASLIMGGALGNLYDRILYGYVVDFIDIRVWPIFNVADIAITIGIGILFITLVREGKAPDDESPGEEKNQDEVTQT